VHAHSHWLTACAAALLAAAAALHAAALPALHCRTVAATTTSRYRARGLALAALRRLLAIMALCRT